MNRGSINGFVFFFFAIYNILKQVKAKRNQTTGPNPGKPKTTGQNKKKQQTKTWPPAQLPSRTSRRKHTLGVACRFNRKRRIHVITSIIRKDTRHTIITPSPIVTQPRGYRRRRRKATTNFARTSLNQFHTTRFNWDLNQNHQNHLQRLYWKINGFSFFNRTRRRESIERNRDLIQAQAHTHHNEPFTHLEHSRGNQTTPPNLAIL